MAYPIDDHYAPAPVELPAHVIAEGIVAEAEEYGAENGYELGIRYLVNHIAFVFEDDDGFIRIH